MWPFLKSILFRIDPERAHHLAIARLERLQWSSWGRALLRQLAGPIPESPVAAMGLDFRHPLGLAAGFDKDARVVLAMQELGFAFVEIGTVTPRPQPGNQKPRLWRYPEANALVNALGFPGEGMHVVARRLATFRESGLINIPIGINIGKNADTPLEKATRDYCAVLEELHDFADYFAVNVSSPNTQGLRSLQSVESLRAIIEPLQEITERRGSKPLLIKIAPDLSDEELLAIAALSQKLSLAGLIAGNTTIRRDLVSRAAALDRGGLSGAPQFNRTLEMISLLSGASSRPNVIVASGGIENSTSLAQVVERGATLIQAYTGFVYGGPSFVSRSLG